MAITELIVTTRETTGAGELLLFPERRRIVRVNQAVGAEPEVIGGDLS